MQRNKPSFVILIISLSLINYSCNKDDDFCSNAPETSGIEVNLPLSDLTDDLIKISTSEEAIDFIEEYPFIANYFLAGPTDETDSAIANRMVNIFTNTAYKDSVYKEVRETFGDFTLLQSEFEKAFQHYKYYYPDVNAPKLEFVLSGLQKDLYISDSLVSIAADYFLGSEASFVPTGVPDYILKRYQKEYIVPMTMLLITQAKNQTDYSDKTLLADMIFYGKSYYLAKQTIPCTPDSLLIGYSSQEMKDIAKNEHIIWANFLENDLLYETSHFIKNKFIGERPKTFEISENCPGRIGVWVGWQIVNAYMKNNPEVNLQELMSKTDVQEIFKNSHYKPRG
ncbi:gliding motility lipoprotein GldB [Marivirga sp. S37H4]|uniref:Gliding motility lipoprotein GldB n=1 Tax=Marivirga aurantiaca TaxID=2802615 RepID=A0A934WZS7_9BACT|nr:gliding motility lipoprotein GldB [Marivirga aurantiaca]MBK6265911.1 gliding motility lipoprotein GldB [Marivirga aurantiaca]